MGKKQHYIPQFFLKNFSDINRKSIGFYRFEEQKFIKNASIKDIAYRIHLYDEDDSVENILAEEEGIWKTTLDVFLGINVTLATVAMLQECGQDYILDLFRFISITEARTAQLGDAMTHMIKTMDEQIGKDMLPETYNQYFGDVGEIIKHPNLIPIEVALENIPYYEGLNFLAIHNFSNQLFITSDSPVLNINPFYEKRKYIRNYGLASMGLIKLLPISGRVCLCLYDRNIYRRKCKDTTYILKSEYVVNQINSLMVENAYAQIFFCNIENEDYIKTLCKNRIKADHKGRVVFFGKDKPELIWSRKIQIRTSFLLPCLEILKTSLSIPLPSHMGGLVRPEVQPLHEEIAQKIEMDFQQTMQKHSEGSE